MNEKYEKLRGEVEQLLKKLGDCKDPEKFIRLNMILKAKWKELDAFSEPRRI